MVAIESKELAHANRLISEGEYNKSLRIVESYERKEGLSLTDKVVCDIIKLRINIRLGQYKIASERSKSVLQQAKQVKNQLLLLDAIIAHVDVLYYLGLFDEGLSAISEGYQYLKSFIPAQKQQQEYIRRKASLLNLTGKINEKIGNEDFALGNYQESLNLYSGFND
jgi:tetratricopeptide (TPR) repeat protein